jgi:hypothetical protein
MNKVAKNILNSLRCPLCQSSVDLYDFATERQKPDVYYNFHCINNNDHFEVWFPHWAEICQIDNDVVRIYYNNNYYRIGQYYPNQATYINIGKFGGENRLNNSSERLYFGNVMFDWQNTNRDKIITRLQTLMTFR